MSPIRSDINPVYNVKNYFQNVLIQSWFKLNIRTKGAQKKNLSESIHFSKV